MWMLTEQQAEVAEKWPNSGNTRTGERKEGFSASADSDWPVGSMSARSESHPSILPITGTLVSFAGWMSLQTGDPHTTLFRQLKRLCAPNAKADPEPLSAVGRVVSPHVWLGHWRTSLVWGYSVMPSLSVTAVKSLTAVMLEQMMVGPKKVKKSPR